MSLPMRVVDSNIVLMVDHELELARSRLFMPLILRYGQGREPYVRPYPYYRYAGLDPRGRCFDNAIRTALNYGLTYVEGLLICLADTIDPSSPKMVSIAHGWCVNGYNELVDPTLHANQHCPSFMYLGLPIKKEYAVEWHRRVGYFGCLDGDSRGRPIGVHYEPPSLWLDM